MKRYNLRFEQKYFYSKCKKASDFSEAFFKLGAWRCPTLTWVTPHYHRRCFVSLLSSEWDQVGPKRYCHQANLVR